MIYKLTFIDGRIDFCTAKTQLHLLQSYYADFGIALEDFSDLEEIPEEAARTTMVANLEWDEDHPNDLPEQISLFDLSGQSEDFLIIASTDWD